MQSKYILALACALPLMLAGCGAADPAAATPVTASAAKRSGAVATEYHDLVQRIYVAYFDRPADPAGLDYWAVPSVPTSSR